MSRISIDVTNAQHQKLKALAALQGKSIKEFVLERTLGADDADAQLDAFLDKRLAQVDAGKPSKRTVTEIG
jgi:uncharacterized protein (DUF1778 family)